MKARICELCEDVISAEHFNDQMLYNIYICEAEGFDSNNIKDGKLFLDLDDVCPSCTSKARALLLHLKEEIRDERRAQRDTKSVQTDVVSRGSKANHRRR